MMSIRKLLIAAAIPLLAGTVGCSAFNSASAANSGQPDAQASPTAQSHGQHRHRIDFAAAAQKLNVSEQQLKDALGIPANPTPGQHRSRPDLKAAAAKLNVTEQQLRDALGIPARSSNQPAPN